MIFVKFFLIITMMVILLRMKIHVGLVLIVSSAITVFTFAVSRHMSVEIIKITVQEKSSITLLFTIYFIYFLIGLMRSTGKIYDLTRHIGESKTSLIFPAMLIGMIPMPGGAVVSAPLVSQVGDRLSVDAETKAYVNYWFRHVWEFGWPMYPAMVLFMNGFTGIPFSLVFAGLIPFLVLSVLTGFFMIRDVKGALFDSKIDVKGLLGVLYPILTLIILYTLFRVDILLSFAASILLYIIVEKIPVADIIKSLKKISYIRMFLLIFGAMLFKNVVSYGNIFGADMTIPPGMVYVLMILLPIFVGFATGLTVAGVSIVVLVVMAMIPEVALPHLLILYVSVFVGIILSPTHLCLILSGEYYKVTLTGLYKRYLLPSVIPLLAGAMMLIIYMCLK